MAACSAPASVTTAATPDETRKMAVLRLYLRGKVALLAHDPCFMDAVIQHVVAAAEVQAAATSSDLADLQRFVLARSRADEASVSMLRRVDALLVSDESLAHTAPELARLRTLADTDTSSPVACAPRCVGPLVRVACASVSRVCLTRPAVYCVADCGAHNEQYLKRQHEYESPSRVTQECVCKCVPHKRHMGPVSASAMPSSVGIALATFNRELKRHGTHDACNPPPMHSESALGQLCLRVAWTRHCCTRALQPGMTAALLGSQAWRQRLRLKKRDSLSKT